MEVLRPQEDTYESRSERTEGGIGLREFFQERERAIEKLDQALAEKAEQLLALMPEGMRDSEEGSLATPRWLECLYRNTQDGGYSDIAIKGDYEMYGFRDRADSLRGLRSLKEAWKGIIDVDINTRERRYIHVKFRLARE